MWLFNSVVSEQGGNLRPADTLRCAFVCGKRFQMFCILKHTCTLSLIDQSFIKLV